MPPFAFKKRSAEFDAAWTRQIEKSLKEVRQDFVPDRNCHRFYHGKNWRTSAETPGDEEGELSTHSVEMSTKFDDIIDHDVSTIKKANDKIIASLREQFMRSLYETVHRSTEKSGNVVDASKHESTAHALLEVFRKIEFSVDENGEISLPQIHIGSEAFAAFMKLANSDDATFRDEFERIKQTKFESARKHESERLAKFPSTWDEE